MFMQTFIELSAAVHELSCWQSDNAENTNAVASAGNEPETSS